MFAFFVSLVLRLGHHHLTELIKVHGPGAVLIQLLNDAIELLVREGGEQLSDQSSQGLVGDVAKTLFVVDPNQTITRCKKQDTHFTHIN